MEEWKTYLELDGQRISIDSIPVATGFDIADGKDESVVSIWDRGKLQFSFTQKLSKKENGKRVTRDVLLWDEKEVT